MRRAQLRLRWTSTAASALWVIVVSAINSATGVPGPEYDVAKCSTTGPTCIHETDCALLPNGVYQWCGGCDQMVRCLDQKPALFPTVQQLYPVWDDYKKDFVQAGASTTCSECYFECPADHKVAPGAAGLCHKTGPTCVDGPQFCNGTASKRRFQYCGGCGKYVDCVFFGSSLSALVDCPDSTFYDQKLEDCIAASRTCRECYESCNETSLMTTPMATTKMASSTTATTKMASSTTATTKVASSTTATTKMASPTTATTKMASSTTATTKMASSATTTKMASSISSTPYSTTPGEANDRVAKGEWRIDGAAMAAILIGALIAALGGVLVGIVIGRRFISRVVPALSPQRNYKVDSSSSTTEEGQKYYDNNELPAKA